MKLYLRGKTWWVQAHGRRISTGQADKLAAELWAANYQRRALILRAISELATMVEVALAKRRGRHVNGVIYAIRFGERIKLGFTSRDPLLRLIEIRAHAGEAAELIAVARGTRAAERLLQQTFSPAHIQGEWFSAGYLPLQRWVKEHRYNSGTNSPALRTLRAAKAAETKD